MILLADTSEPLDVLADETGMVVGQLLTPLTRRKWRGTVFAIDNGAFARFSPKAFLSLVNRTRPHHADCLFVTVPDRVSDAVETCRLFEEWSLRLAGLRLAFVLQDDQASRDVPWEQISAVFIGGSTQWKLSRQTKALVGEAKNRGKWVHMGRVNRPERLDLARSWGVDSIDGTGVSRYTWMREDLKAWRAGPPLFASDVAAH